ncbi:PREDICTED: uncharacterized protein LOC107603658 [Ficedula albicollis]|uniref:uncharacterized protein LOC107603658 n=1 Tax=Ficedula albicollis TaxID=59894 RepID=UPI0007AD9300|nr:PREDICTED: uncharacterized protein LOC107603658 [Ficedula albicollis]
MAGICQTETHRHRPELVLPVSAELSLCNTRTCHRGRSSRLLRFLSRPNTAPFAGQLSGKEPPQGAPAPAPGERPRKEERPIPLPSAALPVPAGAGRSGPRGPGGTSPELCGGIRVDQELDSLSGAVRWDQELGQPLPGCAMGSGRIRCWYSLSGAVLWDPGGSGAGTASPELCYGIRADQVLVQPLRSCAAAAALPGRARRSHGAAPRFPRPGAETPPEPGQRGVVGPQCSGSPSGSTRALFPDTCLTSQPRPDPAAA